MKLQMRFQNQNKNKEPKIIAVSKTFQTKDIMPLVEFGHIHFGENKVQEALDKWQNIKKEHKDVKLHLIGKLQSNKVKKLWKFLIISLFG